MKIDLSDLTFTIPVKIDSDDRLSNITYVVNFLRYNFECKIDIYEIGDTTSKLDHLRGLIDSIIFEKQSSLFHRTKYLNLLASLATTKYIANYDCDVVFPLNQYVTAYNALKNNEIDMIYPYSGYFVNVPREVIINDVNYNVDRLNPDAYQNFGKNSMGGAVLWNKNVFISGGMENENFLSWGCEDWERFRRYTKLGYRIGRTTGPLYHIDHSRTSDSSDGNPHYQHNVAEFQKVDAMNQEELRKYVDSWPWHLNYFEL